MGILCGFLKEYMYLCKRTNKFINMATIIKSLSKREKNGQYEILLRLRGGGKSYDLNCKSGVFVTADNFKNGNIVVNRRRLGNDIQYHEKQEKRLNDLVNAILNAVMFMDSKNVTKEWLKDFVIHFIHPNYMTEEEKASYKTWQEFWQDYANEHHRTTADSIKSVGKVIARWEKYSRWKIYQMNKPSKNQNEDLSISEIINDSRFFKFDINTATESDIQDLFDYMANEYSLRQEHPDIFDCIATRKISERGGNRLFIMRKKVKAFFNWLNKTGCTKNNPAKNVNAGKDFYGEVNYLTLEEKASLAEYDGLPTAMATIRDIFIFQCDVGCRVSDLTRLMPDNITSDGVLVYIPIKTKETNRRPCRVPLNTEARALVEKYKGVDEKGRLFPFLKTGRYNKYLKHVFKKAGITRKVKVLDSISGEELWRPMNEVITSHWARRTFCANIYNIAPDPALICAMSGHVEGSTAFARYRKVEDNLLAELTAKLAK